MLARENKQGELRVIYCGSEPGYDHVDWQAGDLDLGGELVSVWFRLVGTLRTKLAGN